MLVDFSSGPDLQADDAAVAFEVVEDGLDLTGRGIQERESGLQLVANLAAGEFTGLSPHDTRTAPATPPSLKYNTRMYSSWRRDSSGAGFML